MAAQRNGHRPKTHPAVPRGTIITTSPENLDNEDAFVQSWATCRAQEYAADLIRSVAAARTYYCPLGQVTYIPDLSIEPPRIGPLPSQVAFNLELPILGSLPLKEILSMRDHDAAEFQAFRSALRIAIEARCRTSDSEDAERIAVSIFEDVLEPALISIDRRMVRRRQSSRSDQWRPYP